jgi:hypothetical protein
VQRVERRQAESIRRIESMKQLAHHSGADECVASQASARTR